MTIDRKEEKMTTSKNVDAFGTAEAYAAAVDFHKAFGSQTPSVATAVSQSQAIINAKIAISMGMGFEASAAHSEDFGSANNFEMLAKPLGYLLHVLYLIAASHGFSDIDPAKSRLHLLRLRALTNPGISTFASDIEKSMLHYAKMASTGNEADLREAKEILEDTVRFVLETADRHGIGPMDRIFAEINRSKLTERPGSQFSSPNLMPILTEWVGELERSRERFAASSFRPR